jgi:hypothetical protein
VSLSLRATLEADHRRIDVLFARAVVNAERFDAEAFEAARGALLRHIGIEEKILLPALRAKRGEAVRALAERLRIEHGAIGALLVPTPDAALVGEVCALLEKHNPLEEGEDGLYAQCDATLDDQREVLLARIAAAKVPPLAAHFDGHGTFRTAADALRAMEARRARG